MAAAIAKKRALQLTNVLENGETEFNFGYAKRMSDGKGIAFGCLRWRTGFGDGLSIIQSYARAKPGTALARYLPAMEAIKRSKEPGKLTGMDGFEAAVSQAASRDPIFRSIQRDEVDELYWLPSQGRAQSLGLRYDLSKSLLYDTWVQHGQEDKPGRAALGTDTIIEMTNNATSRPAGRGGAAERDWVLAFLDSRQYALATAQGLWRNWRSTVKRIDVYRQLIAAGAWNFDRPIVLGSAPRSSNSWNVAESSFGNHCIS
ncbi:hypothetical protein CBR_g19196 [Chara braunii]|uniref:Uncharacterized protein n=1 Tax=Chara braunii TaxID=69332 RepID=A0A388JTH7_CHABU|nr:hypothetical protein CBR_g19196 [Chara braunii]|eukprot:GBG61119.1 hypothetical protein CBR_g19196 [Chara braunii]